MITPAPIWQKFRQKFAQAQFVEHKDFVLIKLPKEVLPDGLAFLAADEAFLLGYLKYLTVVDWQEHFELLYHLYSYRTNLECMISVEVAAEDCHVPSCQHLWPAANWHEREMYDLFGVVFDNHPNLQRLLLPPDWVGHPLRKDYQEQDQYQGVSTQRNYLIKLPSAAGKA